MRPYENPSRARSLRPDRPLIESLEERRLLAVAYPVGPVNISYDRDFRPELFASSGELYVNTPAFLHRNDGSEQGFSTAFGHGRFGVRLERNALLRRPQVAQRLAAFPPAPRGRRTRRDPRRRRPARSPRGVVLSGRGHALLRRQRHLRRRGRLLVGAARAPRQPLRRRLQESALLLQVR